MALSAIAGCKDDSFFKSVGESLTIWHHTRFTYEDLWHTFWYTFGECSWLVGWQKKTSWVCLSCLFSFACHNFLIQRMTGTEGPMSSNVTGALYRLRNIFCRTARMNIWPASALSTSLSQTVFPPLWGTRSRTFLNQPGMPSQCCIFCSWVPIGGLFSWILF